MSFGEFGTKTKSEALQTQFAHSIENLINSSLNLTRARSDYIEKLTDLKNRLKNDLRFSKQGIDVTPVLDFLNQASNETIVKKSELINESNQPVNDISLMPIDNVFKSVKYVPEILSAENIANFLIPSDLFLDDLQH